ncbi:11348_t:CDS:10 [Entrophospora sp. SA101]|nr:11348_t:CDS:10 [Entrophospora sp. SA101]
MSTTESLSENGVSREALNENSHNIIFQTIVSEWVEDYRNDNVGALLVLINFIIRSCGCNNVVHKDAFKDEEDKDRIDDEDIIVDVLEELKNSLKKLLSDYPLVSKSKDYKKFRKNFLDFFHKLIKQVKHSELYQGVFCENIQAWISIMSNSGYRPFRHTATAVSLNIVTGLCEVAFDVKQEYNIAERQLTLEQSNNKSSRNTKNKDRISSLVTKTDELKGKERIINSYIQGFFDRYRDVEPVIRSECIKELGVWVIKHPDYFLNDTYIRYLGWQLSDKSPLTRQESVKALSRLYNHETFANDLRNFTERFKPRLLEMALRESDIIVRAATINLVTLINEIDLLDRDYRNKFSVLIYSDITKVRKSIAPFIKNVLEEDFVKDKLEKVRIFLSGGSSNTNTNASSVKNGRIGLAIEDLWTELDILHNWQSLAEYLSKDHSLPNSSKTKITNLGFANISDIHYTRAFTDSVSDTFGSFFQENETAQAIAQFKIIDPRFNTENFLKEARNFLIPEITEAKLKGDIETLALWLLSHQLEAEIKEGLINDSKILDIRDVDIVTGKVLDFDIPVLYLTYNVQEVIVFRDRITGEIKYGREDKIEQSTYIIVLTKDEEKLFDPITTGWKIIDAELPFPAILFGNTALIIMYQIGTRDTRVLIDIPGKLPSNGSALQNERLRSMPNSFLPPSANINGGLIMLGDAMNMRHPLTGGGMTVGFNDVVLLSKLLSPTIVPDFNDIGLVLAQMQAFHLKRKFHCNEGLRILAEACFNYFLLGGICVEGPCSLIAGLTPNPLVMIFHLVAIVIYGTWRIISNGHIMQFPQNIIKSIMVLYTACILVIPILYSEIRF